MLHVFTKRASILARILLCLFFLWNASGTLSAPDSSTVGARTIEKSRRSDITKIISTLENRTSNKHVLDKAEEKLCGMSRGKLSLMSSLCDRISADDSAAAEIAYSLVSALIALS